MGQRGRKPQPTVLKMLRGNPGKRPLNDREPQPEPVTGAIEPPAWLDAAAVEKWQEVVPELQRLGLLTVVDVTALASYCWCFSEFRRADAWIKENGRVMTLRDDKGNVKYRQQAPEVGIANKMLESMRRYEQSFGLNPSARSGLTTEKPKSGGVPRRKRA